MKLINLGLRESMSGQQILAEMSQWDWKSFVIVGYVATGPDTEEDGEIIPAPVRLTMEYHPNTDLGDVVILTELAKMDALEGIKESQE